MDYHLDWIAASLWAYENPESVGKAVYDEDEEATGTQQDIDLLIAFKAEVRDHLVLLEAKRLEEVSGNYIPVSQIGSPE